MSRCVAVCRIQIIHNRQLILLQNVSSPAVLNVLPVSARAMPAFPALFSSQAPSRSVSRSVRSNFMRQTLPIRAPTCPRLPALVSRRQFQANCTACPQHCDSCKPRLTGVFVACINCSSAFGLFQSVCLRKYFICPAISFFSV